MKKRIKDLFNISAGGDIANMTFSEDPSSEFKYPVYSNALTNLGLYGYSKDYKVSKPSITITARGNIGFSFIRKAEFTAIGRLLVLTPNKTNINIEYVNYILQQNNISYNKTAIPQLTSSDIANQIIEIKHSFHQQNKIVLFLDSSCAKIDAKLTMLKQKTILLDEYKNALIFETVTKGLDKNAVMKDSGIDWIGETPEHWKIKRFKDILRNFGKSNIASGDADDGEYDFYVSGKKIKKISKWNLEKSSLLLPTGGTFVVHFNANKKCSYSTDVLALLEKNKNVNLKYYYYYLTSNERILNEKLFYGSGLKHLNRNLLFSTQTISPLLKEQNDIVLFLNKETSKIENQIELINQKIELLKEYKQSLIYEAVTGQLEIE